MKLCMRNLPLKWKISKGKNFDDFSPNHTVPNLHFLSKNLTLISWENCRFFLGCFFKIEFLDKNLTFRIVCMSKAILFLQEGKLLYGMLFSIKSFVGKLSPTDMKDGFTCYKTSKYRLNFYETPSKYKFVLNTDTAVTHPIVRDLLQNMYSKVFVEYVIKNPMHVPGGSVNCQLFDTRVDEFVKAASFYKWNRNSCDDDCWHYWCLPRTRKCRNWISVCNLARDLVQ